MSGILAAVTLLAGVQGLILVQLWRIERRLGQGDVSFRSMEKMQQHCPITQPPSLTHCPVGLDIVLREHLEACNVHLREHERRKP